MRKIDFNQVIQLFRYLVVEEKRIIFVLPFQLSLTLVVFGWYFYYRYGDGCFNLTNSLMLAICIFYPVLRLFKDFRSSVSGQVRQNLTATSVEKYVAIWSVSFLAIAYCLLITLTLVGLLLGLILHVGYDISSDTFFNSYTDSFDYRMVFFSLMLTSGGLLYHLAGFQHTRFQRFLPRLAFILSLAWFFILPMFNPADSVDIFRQCYHFMYIFSVPCTVLYILWSYLLFRRVDSDPYIKINK